MIIPAVLREVVIAFAAVRQAENDGVEKNLSFCALTQQKAEILSPKVELGAYLLPVF